MRFVKFLLVCLVVSGCSGPVVTAQEFPSVDECLDKYSLRFEQVGKSYYSAGFIGNGMLGATIYEGIADTLLWELGRVDVVDNRKGDYPFLYKKPRLPIGKFLMPLEGGSSSLTVDLARSEVSGAVRGDKTDFVWRSLTPHFHDVYIIEMSGDNLPEITFRPEVSVSPRFIWNGGQHSRREEIGDYGPNPNPKIYEADGYWICSQPLMDGGEYSTVWKIVKSKSRRVLIASVAFSANGDKTAAAARAEIERYEKDGMARAEKMHRKWWRDFYKKSYVHVGEERYDRFFWTQLYKLGSATRENGYPIDLMGPWYHNNTPWPAIWWNLNIQLTYSPMFAINHCELAQPLFNMLDREVANLIGNVGHTEFDAASIGRSSSYDCIRPASTEHGLLAWTLFYYWKYCTYTNDNHRLTDNFFPLLKLAVNYYRTLLFEGKDGRLHMPLSHSPEYADAEDCNFELAILRWACGTLLYVDSEYGLDDELRPVWADIMDRLVDYPMDEDGFMIGRGVKLESGHRHYSHLLMLYPFNLLDLNEPDNAEIARKSIEFWLHFKKAYYVGYTYTGASSMNTLLGEGELAYKYLTVFLERYMQPNTFYRESGPVFETPMSALASYTEMLLLSKPGEIRIMPAVPAKWKEICYEHLLAEGGYEVSATRRNGATTYIEVRSLYGGKCKIFSGINDADRKIVNKRSEILSSCEQYLEIEFKPGGVIKIQDQI